MKTQSMRALLGGLASIAIGVSALPAGASIIAADGFNYIPSGVSLVTANGGTPLPPATVGWSSAWAADAGATVGPGLTYNYNGIPNIGIGNSVTLGDSITTAGIDRSLGDSSSAGTIWMRMLYKPGSTVEESTTFTTPFELTGGDTGFINLTRQLDPNAVNPFSLTMSGPPYDTGTESAASVPFDISSSTTHMLLFQLTINQNTGEDETLSMWLDPTAAEMGTPITLSANILEAGDYLALFSAAGYGDKIDEIVLGTSFNDVIGQLNDPVTAVPEVSAPVMMLIVSLPAIGVIWFRRRKPARA